ncbi:hypothetical protein BGX23_005953 [Mortierella sp. AD031]|nr:hypothetical protein BGX23_005953 [Mortierella sp. AD031]
MHSATKPHGQKIVAQNERESNAEQEILPDTTVEILRRMAEEIKCPICLGTMERPMSTGCNHTFCHDCILHALSRSDGCPLCKTHVHKRGLNRVDHLEQVIEAFIQLKEAFEQEDGYTLSQAPRHFDNDPQENLTQLYPYPEKCSESSSSSGGPKPIVPTTTPSSSVTMNSAAPARASTSEPVRVSRQPSAQPIDFSPASSSPPAQSQHLEEIDASSDMDCFDVDLDSVSADQAAMLAEKMLAMISLGPPNVFSSSSPFSPSSRGTDRPESQIHPPADTVVVKEEEVEDDDLPTQPRQNPVQVKAEPPSTLDDQALFFNSATQERTSKEANVVICGTYLSAQKKTRMDSVTRSLKGKTVNDLATRPTHVVMDITQEQCQKGSGRTVKFFLGILHASWVVRYEWIVASHEAGYWVDETAYQIDDNEMGCNPAKLSRASRLRGDPPLFTGFEFQLAGTFVTPTRDEIELMVRVGGGTIVPRLFQRDRSVAPNSESSNTNGGSSNYSRHVLLYDQASDGVMSLKRLKSEVETAQAQGLPIGKIVEVVPCKTLLDCISQYDMERLIEIVPF